MCLTFSGCNGCSDRDFAQQLDNGNNNPERLFVTFATQDIAIAIQRRYGASCTFDDNDLDLIITTTVQTTTLDMDGNAVINPMSFFDVTTPISSDRNDTETIEVEVPDEGAYMLFMDIVVDNCSICCHGGLDGQCSTIQNGNMCEAGKPSVFVMQPFMENNRPEFNQDLNVGRFMQARDCVECDCEVDC